MNILVVSQNSATPRSGAGTRNYHLLKALASRHAVTFLGLIGSDEHVDGVRVNPDSKRETTVPAEVRLLTRDSRLIVLPETSHKRWRQLATLASGRSYTAAQFLVPAMQAAIDRECAIRRYDAVLCENALMSGYRFPPGVPVVIDEHNLEYEIVLRTFRSDTSPFRKWFSLVEGSLLRPAEIRLCKRAAAVLVTSERERGILQTKLPSQAIEVVPNGVDTAAFSAVPVVRETPGAIVFTATMDYYPNAQAVRFFAEECWPQVRACVPEATWEIVGRNPPPDVLKLAQQPGITVTGTVPDVRPYLAAASVAIAPLQVGGGTRLKVLEALAMRKAVVSTSLGCEGLGVVAGRHLEIADDPRDFAQAIVALLGDPARRLALGSAGRTLAEQGYAWEKCGDRLLRVVEALAVPALAGNPPIGQRGLAPM